MLSFKQVNALGNILNSSWGKSSSANTFDCKGELSGDNMVVTYSTVIYYASSDGMNAQASKLMDESNARINELIKNAKTEYNTTLGETLALKEISNNDSYELLQASTLNPRKVALYRRRVVFQVG
ncbi:hypothetical protein CL634_04125 [bacterium]|nr:hypothetical protein [bacterium]|tara:strand:+ start:2189 stop:2563 length:375 start_codon:yes stop_codon:yes gene_type:complete